MHGKVQVVRPAFTLFYAIVRLDKVASVLSGNAPFRNLASLLVPRYVVPLKFLRPSKISLEYYPIWWINAQLNGSVEGRSSGPFTHPVSINLDKFYLPGAPLDPLCRVPFAPPDFQHITPSSLNFQFPNDPVTIHPFSISPSSVLNVARSLPDEKFVLGTGGTLARSSIQVDSVGYTLHPKGMLK
ncbi:hypothetical protein EYR36_011967 [Pleurotus pulmonarius]|nr:hypothetical protein EYR36_011967 [Pleurotus pulmonarius]